jgi:hypothetical protein
MPIDIKEFGGSLNVLDFSISSIGEPVLSTDFTKVTLGYVGKANPQNTDVDLTAREYSIDNGVTWDTMTTASTVTGLTFSIAGTANTLIWNIKQDLGNSIYNTQIKIRFQAQAVFSAETITTDYKVRSIYLLKETIPPTIRGESVFPSDYSGTSGTDLLKNAPKTNS